jgi:general secretion pathway protein D
MRRLIIVSLAVLASLLLYRTLREEPTPPQSHAAIDRGSDLAARTSKKAGSERPLPELAPTFTASTRPSVPYLTPAPIQPEHTLDLNLLAPVSVKQGDIFSISINADVQAAVSRYRFEIQYDPGQLESIAATGGNFMEQGSAYSHLSENAAANSGNVAIEVEQDGGGGVEGAGSFAVIQFRALTSGNAVVTLQNIEANESSGRPIRAAPTEPLSVRIDS